jgi:hypothetical protein
MAVNAIATAGPVVGDSMVADKSHAQHCRCRLRQTAATDEIIAGFRRDAGRWASDGNKVIVEDDCANARLVLRGLLISTSPRFLCELESCRCHLGRCQLCLCVCTAIADGMPVVSRNQAIAESSGDVSPPAEFAGSSHGRRRRPYGRF